jgi:hypothetical protein
MSEDRTINFYLDAVTKTKIVEVTGVSEFNNAVGYLSSWNMAFPHLTIHGGVYDGTPEIIATYRKEPDGPVGYQIGAVWHDDHFGFHS